MASGVLFVHGLSGNAFHNHVTHDTHHSSTSVVDLGIKLACLLFGVEVLSEPTNTVVSVVLRGRHPCKLDKGEEEKDLKKSGVGDGTDSINTNWDIGELEFLAGAQVSIENDVVVVDDASNDGSHANTSMFALDSTTTFEGFGFGLEPAKRIVDTKGVGDTDLELIDVQGGGGLSLLDRGESSGGTSKEGGDSELHFVWKRTQNVS